MVDLDELDRLHAALPELEPASWMSHDDEAAIVIATVMCEGDYDYVAEERAKDAVTILRAYPALAAEVRALRAKLAERDDEITALREVAAAAEAYRACREGMQTQGGQNTIDRRDTAARLAAALAKVPR